MTVPFDYPKEPPERRHGPQGYADYQSYRPWLRDEFAFRCVYCLLRERWVPGGFHLDHFLPVSFHPEAVLRYENLLYSCASCNLAKRYTEIPDPRQTLLKSTVSIAPDGSLIAHTKEALRIVEHLGLNGSHYCEFRRTWIRIATVAQAHPDVLAEILGFPADLPDLSKLQPPGGNSKPEGIEQSSFRLRQRGVLPKTY